MQLKDIRLYKIHREPCLLKVNFLSWDCLFEAKSTDIAYTQQFSQNVKAVGWFHPEELLRMLT
jgi:hypothetical protein